MSGYIPPCFSRSCPLYYAHCARSTRTVHTRAAASPIGVAHHTFSPHTRSLTSLHTLRPALGTRISTSQLDVSQPHASSTPLPRTQAERMWHPHAHKVACPLTLATCSLCPLSSSRAVGCVWDARPRPRTHALHREECTCKHAARGRGTRVPRQCPSTDLHTRNTTPKGGGRD